ncbi:CAAX geranylgeranyltransferase alpha subunit [Exophiala xenobiotica]|uniref:Protein farnesyltransferase/geranylgeranyltransferase type-1 subunit alpha n=1 Tax=Lithohypha guttulata TaxID=1690604 RepID=A0ABR0KMC4_9EURO|nr:CAAX geranylgeranyltransferase alpha subunit [Lithohypha guttulata]KAK5328051.1 CAAX geranylgeranyltransferase alpha subunit [Exophiala xenobiotica]
MSTTAASSTATLLPPDAKPPKSKTASYYSIHPHWQDVVPIPQADQTGTLAAIAYSARYSEAMSYLRALMAEKEVSERALALTEDLISMNPAHYTVWIYRMRTLRGLWTASGNVSNAKVVEVQDEVTPTGDWTEEVDETLWDNIASELKWLDEVSFRNLKNYQIWHHRHALADLLPADPASPTTSTSTSTPASETKPQLSTTLHQRLSTFITSEQTFLAQILSLDTKNYHVWSYRQWLCTRFPTFLLPSPPTPTSTLPSQPSIAPTYRTHTEVHAIDTMIHDDLRNNSAWSHRYFLLFGHHELHHAQSRTPPLILKQVNDERLLHAAGRVDTPLIHAEIAYTQTEIRKAPQNGSSWNYLRGVLRHGAVAITTLRAFCEEFLGPDGDLWTDQWIDVEVEDAHTAEKRTEKQELGVRSSHAVEWLSEIYGQDGADGGVDRARECLTALGEKWDVIRKGYWEWRVEKLEAGGTK